MEIAIDIDTTRISTLNTLLPQHTAHTTCSWVGFFFRLDDGLRVLLPEDDGDGFPVGLPNPLGFSPVCR